MLGLTESMNKEKSEGVRYSDEKPHMPESIDFSYTHTTKVSVGDDHGVNTPTNPKTPAAKGYIARQHVSISGLTSDASLSLNGKQGTLEEWIESVQRWVVNVDERKDLVRVKPGKLELMRPGPDEPRYWPAGVHISELRFDLSCDPPRRDARATQAQRDAYPCRRREEEGGTSHGKTSFHRNCS